MPRTAPRAAARKGSEQGFEQPLMERGGDRGAGAEDLEDASDPLTLRNVRRTSLSASDALPKEQQIKLEYNVTVKFRNDSSRNVGQDGQPQPTHSIILKDVAGRVEPGQMLAIMGASGAGKTTLLNAISMKANPENIEGNVLINDSVMTSENLAAVSGFVHQDDLFLATLSPREHLLFIAALSIDESLERRQAMVRDALEEVSLTRSADVLIGGGGSLIKGLSGGERKRLAVASECLTKPPLIFCDEPTSGLDSYMALSVVETLKKLAARGHTIVATIHQPASDVFEMFSHLHLLAAPTGAFKKGGRTFFYGARENTPAFFDSIGFPLPIHYNPADYFIRVLGNMGVNDPEQLDRLCTEWDDRPENMEIKISIKAAGSVMRANFVGNKWATSWQGESRFKVSYFAQFVQNYRRSRTAIARDPLLTKARMGQTIMPALIVGSMFYWSRDEESSRAQNLMGASFFTVLNQGMLGLLGVIQTFPLEIPVVQRECAAGRYHIGAYIFGRMFAELPFQTFFPVVFASIMWFFVGFRNVSDNPEVGWGRFWLGMLAIILTANAAVSSGFAITAATPSGDAAMAVAVGALIVFIVFGGYLVNMDDIPPYWVWLQPFSFFLWGFRLFCIVVFKDRSLDPSSGFDSGNDVLDYLSINADKKWSDIAALITLFVGWRIVSFFILVRRVEKDKGTGM